MGADVVGWRNCELQRFLEPEGFLAKLKLRAYKAAVEAQVEPEKWDTIKVSTYVDRGNGPEMVDRTYPGICEELQAFESGIPDCKSCPLSRGGQPVGCYRYVTYPIDATFEEKVFEFFVSQLDDPESVSSQIYADIVSNVPPEGTGFHVRRGPEGPLAERPEVLHHEWSDEHRAHYVDSAMLLASLFISADDPAVVVAYALFWSSFTAWLARDEAPAEESRTLTEIHEVSDLFLNTLEKSLTDGWGVVVDG